MKFTAPSRFIRRSLALALATGLFSLTGSAFAAGYFVVVPVPGKTTAVDTQNIKVSLSGLPLPAGMVGQLYAGFNFNSVLSVTGDPSYTGYGVRWSVVSGSLPAGLKLNSDGTLSGTPTASGNSSFQVMATYKTKAGQAAYQVVIGQITVSLAQATPPQAITGQAYSFDLKSLLSVSGDAAYSGSGVTWSIVSGALPAGLSLVEGGIISGTPTAAGTGDVTVQATYRGEKGQQVYKVMSLDIKVAISAQTIPVKVLEAFQYDIKPLVQVTGDPGYTSDGRGVAVALANNSTMPAGLAFSSDGVISGAASATGSTAVYLTASYRGVTSPIGWVVLQVQATQLKNYGSYIAWADGTYANSCYGYRAPKNAKYQYGGEGGNGVYRVNIQGTPTDVYCDMSRDGGGWTLVMRGAGGDGGSATAWASTAAVNPAQGSSATAPTSTVSFKYSDATINALRADGLGVFRTYDDGKTTNQRFWPSQTYGHLTPPAGNALLSYMLYSEPASFTGLDLAGSAWTTANMQGGLSDHTTGSWPSIYLSTSVSKTVRWNVGNRGDVICNDTVANCNFTMYVR